MENLATIISIASAAVGLLITTITFIKKFINAIKERNAAEATNLMKDFAKEVVQEVEKIKSAAGSQLNGTTKKELALTKLNQLCIDNDIEYDKKMASDLIEKEIEMTKNVNPRDKDAINLEEIK